MWHRVNRWWGWVLLYGLAIPVFALVYALLPRPFYHATARFENEVRLMPAALAESLSVDIAAGFRLAHPTDTLRVGGWTITSSALRVGTVRRFTGEGVPLYISAPDDQLVRFVLNVLAMDPSGMVAASCAGDVSVDIAVRLPDSLACHGCMRLISASAPGLGQRASASSRLTAHGDSIRRSLEGRESFSLGIVGAVLAGSPDFPQGLPVRSETVNMLKDYADAVGGFPASVEGNYRRMLFISAMTITTLGYGDVVPITGPARFWTAVEAVVGILLIGLFLNSVAANGQRRTTGGIMLTREQVEEMHRALDSATKAVGEAHEALIVGNVTKAKVDLLQATGGLGDAKFVLREAHVGQIAASVVATAAAGTNSSPERRSFMIDAASRVRSEAQSSMVTVAAAALALSVTFREVLAHASPTALWLLKLSWIAFAACVVGVIAERFITSSRLLVHAVGGTSPSKLEKWGLATPHLISLVAFAVGVVALAIFGLVNL